MPANPFKLVEDEENPFAEAAEPKYSLPSTPEAPTPPDEDEFDIEQARKSKLDEILGDKYSDEAREDVIESTKSPGVAEGIGMALAGVGDAISRGYGRQNTDFMKQTLSRSDARRAREREEFDKGRKGTLNKYFMNKKIEETLGREDPTSKMSILAQDLMSKFDKGKKDWSTFSAKQLEPYLGPHQAAYEGELKAETNRINKQNQNYWKSINVADRKAKQDYKELQDAKKKTDFTINALSGLKRAGASGQYQMSNKRVLIGKDALRVIASLESGFFKKDKTIEAELAAQIAALMTGGNAPAAETIKHFMSNTAQSNMAGIIKYVSGNPQQAMTDSIVDHYKHQLETQVKYWSGERNKVTNGQYAKLADVFEKYPEEKIRFDNWASEMFGKGHGAGQNPTTAVGANGLRNVSARSVHRWVPTKNGELVPLVRAGEGWERVNAIKGQGGGTVTPDIYAPPSKTPAASSAPEPGRGGYGSFQ